VTTYEILGLFWLALSAGFIFGLLWASLFRKDQGGAE
jgi:hypothetical protein